MESNPRIILSDQRIKTDITPVSNLLQKLNKIDFVSYTRIGITPTHYDVGVIAQNILEVFPSMILYKQDYIPNINKKVVHTLQEDGHVSLELIDAAQTVNKNDIILMIITHDGQSNEQYIQQPPVDILDHSIVIEKWQNYSEDDTILLYGIRINDFHMIDASQMDMLGAACTKELYQIVQKQAADIKTLQDQVAALQARLS